MRAQFWSLDVIFAIVIFGIALFALTLIWFDINSEFGSSLNNPLPVMQEQLSVLKSELLSQGNPSDWYASINLSNPKSWSNVSIGISYPNGSISLQKAFALSSISMKNLTDYESLKPLLGVSYEYYIAIYLNGSVISIGRNPNLYGAISISSIKVPVAVNGERGIMYIEEWTNNSAGVV
ncbi:MAG: hypothetical protein QXL16_01090 [Candidatus Micrarchaeaceae archaeon]